MSPRQIAKLNGLLAEELREKAVSGDASAAKDYILYGAWKKIKSSLGFSFASKLKVLGELSRSLEVTWQRESTLK
jgi:hypothetical protein